MLHKIKIAIADLFADRAGKWSKVDDYLIISMIVISTVEITISTISGLSVGFQNFLSVINTITILFLLSRFRFEYGLQERWILGTRGGVER